MNCSNCSKQLNPFEIPDQQDGLSRIALCAECALLAVASAPQNEAKTNPQFKPRSLGRQSESHVYDAPTEAPAQKIELERPPIFLLDPGRSPHLADLQQRNAQAMRRSRASKTLKSILFIELLGALLSVASLVLEFQK